MGGREGEILHLISRLQNPLCFLKRRNPLSVFLFHALGFLSSLQKSSARAGEKCHAPTLGADTH